MQKSINEINKLYPSFSRTCSEKLYVWPLRAQTTRAALAYAFSNGPTARKDAVRIALAKWQAPDIGLSFIEVSSLVSVRIRIAFGQTDGSWSYVGTDGLTIAPARSTMNFGWDLTTPSGHSTALHEIGHAPGFPREHQSPFAGTVWYEAAVYASPGGPPNNGSRAETLQNMLEKMVADTVQGSKRDPNAVMHGQFDPGMILKPVKHKKGAGAERRS